MTAVVQIQYTGPSEEFAWVLPVPGIPDVAVSSDLAFTRLQTSSNPQYSLTVDIEGTCRQSAVPSFDCGGEGGSGDQDAGGGADGGAPEVLASGTVGPYDFVVIQIDDAFENAGDVAVQWLTDEGYDVVAPGGDPADVAEIFGSYLENGMNLLAFRLTKGNDTGSIRPIRITYPTERPMIPIRPTAVAANPDMGVMVWVLGQERAVPINYKALELDEALIDWTTGGSNYNQVVIAAANEAGGQGFVTERAGPSSDYDQVVFSEFDEDTWQSLQERVLVDQAAEVFLEASFSYGNWDGFRDVVEPLLPSEIDLDDFISCPGCYLNDLEGVDAISLLAGLNTDVIQPMRKTQELLDSLPYVTRLYTTMSAPEMDLDPEFDFNPDLPAVSNSHSARQVIECAGNLFLFEAPWRVELEDGRVIRGQGGGWPFTPGTPGSLPANARVLELTTSGAGTVVTDNSELIAELLDAHNATIPGPRGGDGCTLRAGGMGNFVLATLLGVGMALLVRRRGRRA